MAAMPWPVGAAKFLDKRPLDESDATVQQFVEVIIRAYPAAYETMSIAGQVGLNQADIDVFPKMRLTWWSILRLAAKEGKMRGLVDNVLRDPTIANWHAQVREIVNAPIGMLLVPNPRPAPTSAEERRDQALRPVVGDKAKLWEPGRVVRVRFLGGTASLHKRIEAAARQWLDHAHLRFEFVKGGDAEVRIAFDPTGGSWSWVGTECLEIPQSLPTVNFGWLNAKTEQEEIDRVVLHEIGHVLGLMHEHGNPASTLRWDRKAVYKSYAGPPNEWTRADVDTNIFAVWPPGYFPIRKIFDRTSIMMFPAAAGFFTDKVAIDWNKTLSPVDKQFVAGLYPE